MSERAQWLIQTGGSQGLDGGFECEPDFHVFTVRGEHELPVVATPCSCGRMLWGSTYVVVSPTPRPEA